MAPKKINEATWPARYTVKMPENDIKALRKSHKDFVNLSADLTLKGTYSPGTTGIVSTAAGRYLNVFLVSLRCLRRTGSNLPVELFLEADEEYDDYFCETLLPSLNARCKVMSHSIGTRLARKLEAFQIKSFAIMSSSFENVLFLDADNLALENPERIFESSMYETMGLIVWPDFLQTSESPILAEVQSPLPAKWTGANNISMESGQIFISKAIHEKTLFLASYYNYYGPSYYYSLFTQGGNGEGDKETFAAAAAYLRNPYYLVEEMVYGFGFFDSNSTDVIKDMEHFKNIGMIQFTPDWHGSGESLRPLFLHWNWPKLDAGRFLDEEHLLQDHTAINHRIFEFARGPGDVFIPWSDISFRVDARGWGQDSEAIAIEQMIRVACVDLRKRKGMEDACKRLRKHYRKVYSGDAV